MPKTDDSFNPSEYTTVAQRVAMFYERFPDGRIHSELRDRSGHTFIFQASVYRNIGDVSPAATGWACEREGDGDINSVACLENTETSAIGRALANLGLTGSTKRPSREEMQRAAANRSRQKIAKHRSGQSGSDSGTSESELLQATADLLSLLNQATAAGYARDSADALRTRIDAPTPMQLDEIVREKRTLRNWLDDRTDVTG